jgi:DNA (cytosine-5)-methyltransferase 1
MKYGSVCSGVEAATVAWHPLGWEPQWFSEIEKFPGAVLDHHYPNTPNLGDMTKFKEWPNDPINLLVGGTPCQSFSVAGLRKGLGDPRGNLMLTYVAIAARYKPRWLVWENVPGVLSSNGGRDFGTFLTALGEIGYGFAYRVLDAQYFGVAQRRRRVFVVGYLGDWRRAAAVLFERESLSGHPAPSRETRQEIAPTVTSGAPFSRTGNQRVETDALVAKCITRGVGQRYDFETETFPIAFGAQNSASQGDSVSEHVTPTLDKSKTPAVAYGWNNEFNGAKELMPTIQRGGQGGSQDGVMQPDMKVRRLTPIECERLQGFPDNYTQIPWRNKEPENCPDGPRYKAMGNSMAVPVMRWIGERIQMVEEIQ